MSPLPSQEELRRLKALETAELDRRREWEVRERRGLEEAHASYWGMLEDFVVRAGELGIEPRTHEPPGQTKGAARLVWVDGFRLRSGSIVSAPSSRYCVRERRLVFLPREEVHEVEEIALFVLSTEPGLTSVLSEPQMASQGAWPPLQRWDRAANVLNALAAELEATLLEFMDSRLVRPR